MKGKLLAKTTSSPGSTVPPGKSNRKRDSTSALACHTTRSHETLVIVMNIITPQAFEVYIRQLKVGNNLKRRLTAAPIVAMADTDWDSYEMFGASTKDGGAGILFMQSANQLYAVPYELGAVLDAMTGRSRPIICDFCKTWQAGSRAGTITFHIKRRSANVIGFLCCADLQCSLHVRDLTSAAKTSRSQLREDVTVERRVTRLQAKLAAVIQRLSLQSIT